MPRNKTGSGDKPGGRGGAKRSAGHCEHTFSCESNVGRQLQAILEDIPQLKECYLARGNITIRIENP